MSHHTIAQSNAHSGSIVADATPAPSSPRSTGQGVTLRFTGAPSIGRPALDLPRDAASALPAIEYRVASLRALTPSGGPSEGSQPAEASPDGSSSRTSAEVDVAPLGEAEVRAVFTIGKSAVAGCYVTNGKLQRNCKVRVWRGKEKVYEGDLDSLRRGKDDQKEVATGFECGIGCDRFANWQEGDRVEAYKLVTQRRTLST